MRGRLKRIFLSPNITNNFQISDGESSSKDPFDWVDDWNSNSVFPASSGSSQSTAPPKTALTKTVTSTTTTTTTTTTTNLHNNDNHHNDNHHDDNCQDDNTSLGLQTG